MHERNRGFTLVELVVVIVLLGILAATALPRFMDVDSQAHQAIVDGTQGSLQSGLSLYHAQWMAEGQPDPDTPITAYNGLRNNAAGYPYGTTDRSGGTSDVTDETDCAAVFGGLLQAGGAPTVSPSPDAAGVVGSTTDFTAVASVPNCVWYYTGETSASGATLQTLTYASASGDITSSTAVLP